MSEVMQPIAVKLDAATLVRLDDLAEKFYPFCEGRSALIRILLQVALASIDNGSLRFDLESIQALLSAPRTPKLVTTGGRK